MSLSNIVRYLNELEAIDFSEVSGQAQHNLSAINYVVSAHDTNIGFYKARIQKRHDTVIEALHQYQQVFKNLKDELAQTVRNQEKDYYKNSTKLYQTAMQYDTDEHVLNRRLGIDDESNMILRSRLRNYTDWRTPGMIIHPGHESFIEDMVPLDPLYVLDVNQDLMLPAVNKFNEQYRARLRCYQIDESRYTMLNELPQQQFGCIFSYNFFNYRPIELIERYLKELYECLRPGGVLLFTYNDCDQAHGVELFEKNFMCYTPGHRIKNHAEDIGFDLIYHYIGKGDLAWLEFRKPGQITSLRGGQTLAQIVRK
jgi:SAM-dependent methyltransferase